MGFIAFGQRHGKSKEITIRPFFKQGAQDEPATGACRSMNDDAVATTMLLAKSEKSRRLARKISKGRTMLIKL
ncbi:MAG: hypothetical protein A2Z25_21505 [Planctomycetes bacterium RBG_16_55_9]|nr:MAG: hypothetical protein A2Z25_21505 [Planctomycetes bacterium RBG_16_55_9]